MKLLFILELIIFFPFAGIAQEWNEVKVGETDIVTICKGADTIWEKPSGEFTYSGQISVSGYVECNGQDCDTTVYGIGTFTINESPDNIWSGIGCEPDLTPETNDFNWIAYYYYGCNCIYISGGILNENSNLTNVYINGIHFILQWDTDWNGWICYNVSNPFLNHICEYVSISMRYNK
jgi:hypothetical protein